jgi:alkaline phosphatase D
MRVFNLVITFIISIGTNNLFAQEDLLQSGPMVGYSEMREVLLWVQTTLPANVKCIYWDTLHPQKKFSTNEVLTEKNTACTAKLIADSVQPGKGYKYEVFINRKTFRRPYPFQFQTPKLWKWREDPPDYRIAVGSCVYINEPEYDRPGIGYGGNYEIFTSIYNQHPDAMLWLGDNNYLRESDWNTRTGILHRYTHSRSVKEMQPLLASVSNYAIWDDHDFGPNDSDRGYWNKETTLEAFKLFTGNPGYGINGKPGVTTTFEQSDVQFFLMDNRYYRTADKRKTGERRILGKEQIDWLLDNLASSTATFKIVALGGQVLNPVAKYENYATYPDEMNELLTAIERENISGVLFLSGDRHHTELTKLERKGTYPLYDLTSSPLTSSSHADDGEQNTLRVQGTLVNQRNFAILEFTGKKKERAMNINVYDKDGKQLWKRIIPAAELQATEIKK